MKPLFARHGILDVIISDKGPQYSSWEFQQFAEEYEFTHVTSSPYHSQGNRDAECVVQGQHNRSGQSGFGRTIISQSKIKIPVLQKARNNQKW